MNDSPKLLISGKSAVLEALKNSSVQINKVFLSNSFLDPRIKHEIISLSKEKKIPLLLVPEEKLNSIFEGKNHQGIIASISPIKYRPVKDAIQNNGDSRIILVAHEIEDNHNLGAIIRTFLAGGGKTVILTGKSSVGINATTIKTSANTLFHGTYARATNCINILNELKKNDFWTVGTDNSKDSTSLYKVDLPDKIAIVVGNEHEGLGPLIKKNCDFLIKIPIDQKVNSLNVSVAFGIIMFEVLRQK